MSEPINTLCLLDTETSGLDPAKDPLVEIACVRWSVQHVCVLSAWSTLVAGDKNEAESVNRIPVGALAKASPREAVFGLLKQIVDKSDVIVAHNAAFDSGFLPQLGKPWVCSMEDLQWPGGKPGGFSSVVGLALANDIAIANAHRALSDCLLLARLFERMVEKGMDVRSMIQHGLRPKATFLSLAPYEEREVVKSHGFKWFPAEKAWKRRMAVDDVAGLPFKVRQVA